MWVNGNDVQVVVSSQVWFITITRFFRLNSIFIDLYSLLAGCSSVYWRISTGVILLVCKWIELPAANNVATWSYCRYWLKTGCNARLSGSAGSSSLGVYDCTSHRRLREGGRWNSLLISLAGLWGVCYWHDSLRQAWDVPASFHRSTGLDAWATSSNHA